MIKVVNKEEKVLLEKKYFNILWLFGNLKRNFRSKEKYLKIYYKNCLKYLYYNKRKISLHHIITLWQPKYPKA